MTPSPPARAIAIAMRASVTVSMFAATIGAAIVSLRVSRAEVSTSRPRADARPARHQEDVVVREGEREVGHGPRTVLQRLTRTVRYMPRSRWIVQTRRYRPIAGNVRRTVPVLRLFTFVNDGPLTRRMLW